VTEHQEKAGPEQETDRQEKAGPEHETDHQGPVIRDKRRLDPETGQLRQPTTTEGEQQQAQTGGGDTAATGAAPSAEQSAEQSDETDYAALAAERLEDLRRLQAEYLNYKRRVERERARDRDIAVASVVEALLPVLDDIHSAREHGDLQEGPFVAIAQKLEDTLGRLGAEKLGVVGEEFDPNVHDALIQLSREHLPEGATTTTIVQVMQPGFKVGDRLVRPARVAVANPESD
jgi:molecular chaperone GrpE